MNEQLKTLWVLLVVVIISFLDLLLRGRNGAATVAFFTAWIAIICLLENML